MTKILLVEDNEMNRDMLSRRLVKRGYEVLVAADGEECLKITRSERPDVILMDLSLPVLDGLEATRRIRSEPAISDIAIIALTAHALASDRDRALDAGCDDYDTKPVELDRLLRKIEDQLTRSHGKRS